ncbi:hypothetical protein UA08_09037 [Talaromyces atroroseus]|uniref:Uncharacterized protein n=1 Tax=Talaromyces atroroseus TaxID=1441469 RepID=A0A1Q5Q6Y6_TALAT|nr:hypothetical protein UA08_09037 [Talaromyces atroroseus]OKL55602.1 hypothetical protein UA08_09037 [Talaromyces atroroseus]
MEDKEPPVLRPGSPSPSIPPTPAISSCPSPDRSFSTVSSVSNFSANSATSGDNRSSVLSAGSKRRGYIRPQGVEFAESAKNRESVMCLGSIAHLQYYFARTGLLDGKGAQMARPKNAQQKEVPKLLLTQDPQFTESLVDSPLDEIAPHVVEFGDNAAGNDEEEGEEEEEEEELMLPPTVSTYSVKTHHIAPPPKLKVLRKDLVGALDKASLAVKKSESAPHESATQNISTDTLATLSPSASSSASPKPLGWDEVQGVHILDLVTLAIRAARVYYINHEHPDRLAGIKSERQFREELLAVTDVLKSWASRNFAGGLRKHERASILGWMAGVLIVLDEERRLEEAEAKERASWDWASGDWTGREREREEAFLQTLVNGMGADITLPKWTSPEKAVLPTPFLSRLRDGRDLIRMHNQAVRKSRRLFGEIKTPHEDIAKPYRRAENLRYWRKAAELRWEIKLELDVMGVVYGSSDDAWRQFDAALLEWCRGVREEMLDDWRNPRKGSVASILELPTIFDAESLAGDA